MCEFVYWIQEAFNKLSYDNLVAKRISYLVNTYVCMCVYLCNIHIHIYINIYTYIKKCKMVEF